MTTNNLPIGVFDSGVGGLTVLSALEKHLPNERFLYLGDTARVPYGIKSQETVIRYAEQASELLFKRGIKLLVIACNTATTLALPALQQKSVVPVIGVVEPGAEAACRLSKTSHIAVIATEATINSKGYDQAIKKLRPEAKIVSQSCGLFVSLVEEGFVSGPIAEAVVRHYLQNLMQLNDDLVDCLVLGCTHFPVLAPVIAAALGDKIVIVDSAQTTAEKVAQCLQANGLNASPNNLKQQTYFMVTDAPERFARVARYFLQKEITLQHIELVDLH